MNYDTWKLLDLHISKQGNTTNKEYLFSIENERRADQEGLDHDTLVARQMLNH